MQTQIRHKNKVRINVPESENTDNQLWSSGFKLDKVWKHLVNLKDWYDMQCVQGNESSMSY